MNLTEKLKAAEREVSRLLGADSSYPRYLQLVTPADEFQTHMLGFAEVVGSAPSVDSKGHVIPVVLVAYGLVDWTDNYHKIRLKPVVKWDDEGDDLTLSFLKDSSWSAGLTHAIIWKEGKAPMGFDAEELTRDKEQYRSAAADNKRGREQVCEMLAHDYEQGARRGQAA